MIRSAVFSLTAMATVLAATAAGAAEAPERELQMLGRCALAVSVYRSLVPMPPANLVVTDADRDLYARIAVVEPALKRRADGLASSVEPARRDEILAELKGQFQAQMSPPDGPRKTPREALDLYAPIVEACVVRAGLLPAE